MKSVTLNINVSQKFDRQKTYHGRSRGCLGCTDTPFLFFNNIHGQSFKSHPVIKIITLSIFIANSYNHAHLTKLHLDVLLLYQQRKTLYHNISRMNSY